MTEYIVDFGGSMAMLARIIESQSANLREEIVRCRDCKHHHEGECMMSDGMGDFKRWFVDDDGYCSDGERAVGA